MTWDDIQKYWPDLRDRLRADHPDLSADELERTPEGRRQLLQLIEAKYGTSKPIADDTVEGILGNKENGHADNSDH
ncbi:MAG: hypothetical protein AAFR34_02650 [Pseudomonadota bacterium]